MTDKNTYIAFWQKYRPAILSKMRAAITEPQEYQLTKQEVEAIGEKVSSGYSFNIDIENGSVVNNIGVSAVARDLMIVLQSSPSATSMFADRHFKISMTQKFLLKIATL